MPDLAKHIEVIREGGRGYSLRVDGEEFPFLVGETITTETGRDAMPSVKLELFADRVDVRDDPWPSVSGRSRQHDPTGRLARAEAARDQAEELLLNAQEAIEDNHATMEQLRAELKAARSAKTQVAEALGELQGRQAAEQTCCWQGGCCSGCPKTKAPQQGSMLDAAKLSLKAKAAARRLRNL